MSYTVPETTWFQIIEDADRSNNGSERVQAWCNLPATHLPLPSDAEPGTARTTLDEYGTAAAYSKRIQKRIASKHPMYDPIQEADIDEDQAPEVVAFLNIVQSEADTLIKMSQLKTLKPVHFPAHSFSGVEKNILDDVPGCRRERDCMYTWPHEI